MLNRKLLLIIYIYICPYLPEILKIKLTNKSFSDKKYYLITNGNMKITISNKKYSFYI